MTHTSANDITEPTLVWPNKDKTLLSTEAGEYGYFWTDKDDPRVGETKDLVYDQKVSGKASKRAVDGLYGPLADLTPTEDNLAVLGDSGDVLDALLNDPDLAKRYRGKIKLAYIDPPFNTGKEFSHYGDKLDRSIWLTLMRDRLASIKELLAPEGSIWVHLDDKESHRARMLLDEVFGPENYVAELAVEMNPKGRQLGDGLARSHDTIYVYSKTSQYSPNSGDSSQVDLADFPHRTSEGVPFRYLPLRNTNKKFNPTTARTMYFPIHGCPETGTVSTAPFPGSMEVSPVFGDGSPAVWRWSRPKIDAQSGELEARIVRGRLGDRLDIFQIDTAEKGRTKKFKTIWLAREVGSSDSALNEIKALFPGEHPFATPKPERLLERIIHIATNPGDIVLDVFAGSGTTAAVAHKMGRRWVTAELSESNFTSFTVPRLTKVVNGTDPGGITTVKGDREDATEDGLPEGLTPEEAQKLTSLLNKAIKGDDTLKSSKDIKAVKKMVKTVAGKDTVNWLGGGSFHVCHLTDAPAIEETFSSEVPMGLAEAA